MPLELVRIENLRCIERAELGFCSQRNYIYGPNGAGKTSVLEAIYVLGRGRSFRTRQNKRLIRHGEGALSVYGEAGGPAQRHRLAVGLGDAGLDTRLDGTGGIGIAELARILPVNVVDPNVHQLIEGGPSKRRRFLDWGVFHVEQGFLEAWRRYRRVLGQRNAALKLGQGTDPWDLAFQVAGEAVHAARQRYFELLAPAVGRIGKALTGRSIGLSYRCGWGQQSSLAEALQDSRDRDRSLGATQVGPHRADLRIAMDDHGVREEASRGQQKLVAAGLILSQVEVFAGAHAEGGVLLVDDPAAELDNAAYERLMLALQNLPAQLILTGLTETALPPAMGSPVFHVERGEVRAVV